MQKHSLIKILYILTLLTVASIPFNGLAIEIGATFSISDILSLLATLTLFLYSTVGYRKAEKRIPRSFYFVCQVLLVFFLISLLGNLTFLLDKPNVEAQRYFARKFGSDELEVFRTILKPLQAFTNSIITFAWVIIPIVVIRAKYQIIQLAWIYVVSSSLQAALGLMQFIYFFISGINLFPIYRGGLFGENSFTQDAYTVVEGIKFLRINAFAGEPKNLALVLCFGIATTYFIFAVQALNKTRVITTGLLLLQVIALTLTFSTLGYFISAIGIFVITYSSKNKLIFILLSVMPIGVFCFLFSIPSILLSVFQTRFLERIGFEDMDLVYISFIQDSPSYLLLGTGFGTFHLASFNQTSEIISTWKFGIILPKLGVLHILAVSGFLGLAVLSTLLLKLLSKLSLTINLQGSLQKDFYIQIRTLVIYMIIVGVLVRLTTLGLLWVGIGFATTNNYFMCLDKKQIKYLQYYNV